MQKIKLNEIRIPERFRKDPGDIPELAASFKANGQLQPIIVDQNNVLCAGYRRLCAAALLEWPEIGFERFEGLTELRRREIELEENIRRKQFDWKEEVEAIAEIHRMRQADDPKWTAKQTAELVGRGERLAQYAVKLADNLDIPEVKDAGTMLGAIQRLTAHEQIKKKLEEASQLAKKAEWEILEGDALEQIKRLKDASIDCIITDPPFGIELNYRGEEHFDDSPKASIALVEAILPELYRVMKMDTWLLMFFDTVRMQVLADLLEKAGFNLKVRMPGIWYKPNKTTSAGRNPSQILTVAYESFLLVGKGEPVLIKKGRQNVFVYDSPTTSERGHPTQKPTDLAEELVETLTVGGQLILDPFAGSGAFGVGALRKQRKFIGIEAKHEFADKARVNLSGAL